MRSKANIFGHAIHPALVTIPLGILVTAFGFDVAHYVHNDPGLARATAVMIAVGVVAGLVAALVGAIDLIGVPRGSRAQKVGLLHALLMVTTVVLFAVSWVLRYRQRPDWDVTQLGFVLEIVAVAAGSLGGVLGGELVQRFGISVHVNDTPIDAVEKEFWG